MLLVQAMREHTVIAEERFSDVLHARHTAKQWQANGLRARVLWPGAWGNGRDHVEIYYPDGSMRAGSLEETGAIHE